MKKHLSFRLTLESARLLKEMATRRGINQTAMLEVLIREKAQKEPQAKQAKGE